MVLGIRFVTERSSKMETSCWFCKKWEEHYYWDHLKLTNHRFMKVMLKDFSQGMAIPNQFVKNFKGELSETINLEVITGKLWQFSLQKISGLLCIRDGWEEFVDDHGIKEGEYLVFTCSGNSSFLVQIFDNGGCLRDACHSPAEKAKTMTQKRCQKLKKLDDTLQSCYSSLVPKSKEKQPSGHRFSSIIQKSKNESLNDEATHLNRKISYGQVSQSSMLARRCFKQKTIVLHKAKKLKSEKRSIELQLTNAIQPESPYFIKLVRESTVNYRFFMAIPYDFISMHFNDKPEKVTLQNPQGKKWYVNCNYCGPSWGFRGETWKKFVQENYLKVGDECAFELKTFTTKNSVMNVHIVRATEADLP